MFVFKGAFQCLTCTQDITVAYSQPFDNCKPLLKQLIDNDYVIQIDFVRPFILADLWKGLMDDDSFQKVYLYSTERSEALYARDELTHQRLYYDNINIFGSVVDVFGSISGQERPFVLGDRDLQRNFPTQTFDGVVWRLGWAMDLMIGIVPTTGGLIPKDIRSCHLPAAKRTLTNLRLTEDTQIITDPEKVFISSDKKPRMCRFGHGVTYGDVLLRLQQLKSCFDIGLKTRAWKVPDEAVNRKADRELLLFTSESRFKTKLTVTMKGQWYACWFEPQQVCFTDVMISVGKQAEVKQCLFPKKLYCCGCRRQLSREEEPHQAIPATCCSVKSMQLTDSRMKDVIQSAGSRRRDVETHTLDPE